MDVVPCDAWVRLPGIIEQVVVKCTVATAMDIVFFSSAATESATPSADKTIDFHPFAASDFHQLPSGDAYVASAQVTIPYYDADLTKKFHIGWINSSGTTINNGTSGDVDNIRVEWAWRPNAGAA